MAEGFEKFKFFILDILQTIVIAGALFLIVWQVILQPHKVDGRSMEPTFCNGDMILTDKASFRFRDPERLEIVVFQSPAQKSRDLIKRVIALPGDAILLENNTMYVNGSKVEESYLPQTVNTYENEWLREGATARVPNDEYVLIGDNREHSEDSRRFGPVKRKLIRGRVWIRYWPMPAISVIPRGDEQLTPRQASCS